ncbi:MAG: pyridoxamine 5'-phosphate oxidase family protein [Granulosicoccus sp.]|nr:pyridoxamine 5'-phosphate oxidase family protein [Granulosicoccus sp.]
MPTISSAGLKAAVEHHVDTEDLLRSLYGDTHPLAVKKCLPALDDYCCEYISRSPFLCLSTQHAGGRADVSPRGDPAGFVTIIDQHTVAIPDRPGNNRLDSLSNIISNPSVGLLFLVPGFDDTLRVNGEAFLSRDPDLLSGMSVMKRTPTLAIVVEIKEAFLHCAKAFRRSRLWQAEALQDRLQLPSLATMVSEQISGVAVKPAEAVKLGEELEEEYRQTMY